MEAGAQAESVGNGMGRLRSVLHAAETAGWACWSPRKERAETTSDERTDSGRTSRKKRGKVASMLSPMLRFARRDRSGPKMAGQGCGRAGGIGRQAWTVAAILGCLSLAGCASNPERQQLVPSRNELWLVDPHGGVGGGPPPVSWAGTLCWPSHLGYTENLDFYDPYQERVWTGRDIGGVW